MFLTNKWNQLALFLLILGVNMIIFSFLAKGTAQLIWHSQSMDNPAIARYTNSITLLGIFGITALLYAFIINRRKPFAYLKMDKGLKWNSLLLIILILCASMPALSWIIKWNESLHLPQVFSSVEQKMRQMEDSRAILTKQMLAGTSLSVLFANLLAMAIVPAICEELFFRGVLLSWLKESFHNKHLAVWLSAIVFSAIHIQFFGFFPRVLLGVYLGYLFLWTGSLWTAIIAHFLNNAIAIAAAFLYNIGCTTTDYQQVGNADEKVWAIALSCCFTTTLILGIWKKKQKL